MLLTRSPLSPVPKDWFSLDLHVLSAPPAFVLSQDQTLREGLFARKCSQEPTGKLSPSESRRLPEPRRRIRKLRLFGLLLILFVLGSLSFTFGLVTSVASEIPSLDPARLQQREVDGYIYDRKGEARPLGAARQAEPDPGRPRTTSPTG